MTIFKKSCIGRYRNITSKYGLLNYSVRAFTGFNMQYLIIFMQLAVIYRNISRNLMQKFCIVLFYFCKTQFTLMMAISTYLILRKKVPSTYLLYPNEVPSPLLMVPNEVYSAYLIIRSSLDLSDTPE